jgi:polyphosphate kinase
MSEAAAYTFEDRELSWLSFNERVLQEARDRTVPIYERLFFLGIFSSNLDEFYRVRVASLRSLLRLKEKAAGKLDFNPHRLLGQIRHRVVSMQEEFGRTLAGILQELEDLSVAAVRTDALNSEQAARLREYFDGEVRPHLTPVLLTSHAAGLFLRDRGLYLVVELWPLADASAADASDAAVVDARAEPEYALVEVPSPPLPRFVTLPSEEGRPTIILFLDDVIRMNLPRLFGEYEVGDAYAVKLSRDAELYLDEDDLTDEFARGMAKLIRKSLSLRQADAVRTSRAAQESSGTGFSRPGDRRSLPQPQRPDGFPATGRGRFELRAHATPAAPRAGRSGLATRGRRRTGPHRSRPVSEI